jgi:hypothetical protein
MRAGNIWFWICWGIDALVASIFGYFFLIGISDGTVSSFNIVEWLVILAVLAVVLGGSFFLWMGRHVGWAIAAACVLALPGAGAALFFAFLIISEPRWN